MLLSLLENDMQMEATQSRPAKNHIGCIYLQLYAMCHEIILYATSVIEMDGYILILMCVNDFRVDNFEDELERLLVSPINSNFTKVSMIVQKIIRCGCVFIYN